MKVLVACEESQEVCKAFRARGHEAYSCDLIECSGGHPEWHIQDNVKNVLRHDLTDPEWDMVIAFPPCTRLTVTANKWYKPEYAHRFPNIQQEREDAINFFMFFTYLRTPFVAIENPVGIMSTHYQKPSQIIQPYQFGHKESKRTCLWLHNLKKLVPTEIVEPEYLVAAGKRYSPTHYNPSKRAKNHLDMLPPSTDRAKIRSKTYPGIAKAMAEQWG